MDHDETRTVNVTQRLRPLRLAFLIQRDNRHQALEAVRACTQIWGGALCPIIPVYRQTPRWSRQKRADITNGWIDAFEPDAIVEATPGLASDSGYQARLVLSPADVLAEFSMKAVATTVWRAYASAYDEVYRFKQRHPEDAVQVDPLTTRDALWVAAYFGLFAAGEPLRQGYEHTFDPISVKIGEGNFADLLFRPSLTTPLDD